MIQYRIQYKVKIIDIIDETNDAKTYLLEKPEQLSWNAGSHVLFGLDYMDGEAVTDWTLFRYMSLMTLSKEGKLGFSTKVPGSSSEFKAKLSKLHVGDEIGIFRVGSVLEVKRCNQPIIFLSMGVGIATMRPLLHTFIDDMTNVPYMINVNTNSTGEYLYRDELEKLESNHYKNYWLKSRIEFYRLLEELTEVKNAIYYIVGSDDFMKDVIKELKSKEVDPSNIILDRLEEFAHSFYGL